jgi:hypothetical protein
MMETLLLREGWATRMESFSIFSLHTWQLLRLDEDTSSRMSRVRSRSTSALPEEAMSEPRPESRRPVEAGEARELQDEGP